MGKVQADLNKRTSKVKSLKIQLQMVRDHVVLTEGCTHAVEEKKMLAEEAMATIKEA